MISDPHTNDWMRFMEWSLHWSRCRTWNLLTALFSSTVVAYWKYFESSLIVRFKIWDDRSDGMMITNLAEVRSLKEFLNEDDLTAILCERSDESLCSFYVLFNHILSLKGLALKLCGSNFDLSRHQRCLQLGSSRSSTWTLNMRKNKWQRRLAAIKSCESCQWGSPRTQSRVDELFQKVQELDAYEARKIPPLLIRCIYPLKVRWFQDATWL